jgi:hypothetical protein
MAIQHTIAGITAQIYVQLQDANVLNTKKNKTANINK